MTLLTWIAVQLTAYILGSIPFGLLLVRWRTGRDVRDSGSGNIGATNVLRTAGKGWGILTLALDAAKGALAVLLAMQLIPDSAAAAYGAGLAAVLGHIFSFFLRFQGGKGVATCLGVFLVLSPAAVLVTLAVFILVVFVTRFVAAGSVISALAFPPAAWWLAGTRGLPLLAAVLCALAVIYSHRSNISRILRGEEHRLGSDEKEKGDGK